MSVEQAVAEFRAALARQVASPIEYGPAAEPAELASLESALGLDLPSDLRALWEISAQGPWVFSSDLISPSWVLNRHKIWEDVKLTWQNPPTLSGRYLPIGGAGGGAVMYSLDEPDHGAMTYIHPQTADERLFLADSLENYINIGRALVEAGHLRVETAGPGDLYTVWELPDDGLIPETVQGQLAIGPEFY